MRAAHCALLFGIAACRVQELSFTPLGDGGSSSSDGGGGSQPIMSYAFDQLGSGIYWDPMGDTLYFTDASQGKLLSWTSAGLVLTGVSLPAGSLIDGISPLNDQLVMSDFHAAFYAYSAGVLDVFGSAQGRRREQFDATAGYEVYFIEGSGAPVGHLAQVTIDLLGQTVSETDIMLGSAANLRKATGLAIDPNGFAYISDALSRKILRYDLVHNSLTTITSQALPDGAGDQLCLLQDGTLLTGGGTGGIYRVDTSGSATQVIATTNPVTGIAYDATSRTLFAIEHDPTRSGSDFLRFYDISF